MWPGVPGPDFETLIITDVHDGALTATSVTVRSKVHGVPVTGTVLRSVRVADLSADVPAIPYSVKQIRQLRDAGIRNPDTAAMVANLYKAAESAGSPPAKTVRESIGLSTATATRWIRHARNAGLI